MSARPILSYASRVALVTFALGLASVRASAQDLSNLPHLMPDDLFRRNIGGQGDMDRRFPPHRIMDNLYYVGTASLGSFLITTPAGNILVNTCFERTVPLIQQSIEELGFRFEDIKIILGSHAHGDHMEGDARAKRLTGAQVMVMAEDIPLLRPNGNPSEHPVDRVLHDGDTITLGGETLMAHLTPGHTPGCTSWELTVQEDGKTYTALINCSIGVNPNYQLYQNADDPRIVDEYRSSYAKLRSLHVDVPLGSHPGMYNMEAKYARIGQKPNPFIDPQGYLYEIAINEQAMQLRLEEQRLAAEGH
jgi:metallo-beta-lactamase class B